MKPPLPFIRLCLIVWLISVQLGYAQPIAEFKATSPPFRFTIVRTASRSATFGANANGSTSPPFRFNIRTRVRQRVVPSSYALFIANATYDDKGFRDLPDATFDAQAISDTLKKQYGFQTEVVPNANYQTLTTTLQAWNNHSWQLGEQLLIYISGHGEYTDGKGGYLIMKDSGKDDQSNYFPLDYLKSLIQHHKCPHILLVLDVCYGGAINQTDRNEASTPTTKATCDDQRNNLTAYFSCVVKDRTRLYLSSGSLDVVRGGRSGAHSPFAESLLQTLSETAHSTTKSISISELRQQLKKANPDLTFSSEAVGDFLFVLDRPSK